jgi:hypothetical protein
MDSHPIHQLKPVAKKKKDRKIGIDPPPNVDSA